MDNEKEKTIYEILSEIQQKLKVPKSKFNEFGNYNYRSCEDILEAIKPLLPNNCYILLSDIIEHIGDRFYVKAEAIFCYNSETIRAYAYAREPLNVKKQSEAQTTGSSSSYARKYALNGLLLLDDVKDPDTQKNIEEKVEEKEKLNLNEHNPTKPEQLQYIQNKIMEMSNDDISIAKRLLIELSTFEKTDGTINKFESFRDLIKASDKRISVIYGKTKKKFNQYLDEMAESLNNN